MFTVLSIAAVLVASASAACTRSVSCPCGTRNTNYTFCTDGLTIQGNNPCARWSHCETCKEGVPVCITCPSSRSGPLCKTVPEKNPTRKKRQFQYQRHGDDGSSSTMRIGSCPPLKSPSPGTISCTKYDNYGYYPYWTVYHKTDCTGRCVPGYNFEGNGDKNEITLHCRSGTWYPLQYYPPCKSDNYCELVGRTNSKFNCTIGVDGTRCDIACHYRYIGRFHCFPGRPWKPTLPYCVVSKVPSDSTPPCQCQNGGTCDNQDTCSCPRGWTGTYCEHARSATCPDPGFLRGGDRTNPDGQLTSYPRTYREKEFVVYSCKGKGMALEGKPLITCTEGGTWSAPLPKCVRSKGTVCPDPGQVRFANRQNEDWSPADTTRAYSINQYVVYTCHQGYQLYGSNVLTCLQSGSWSRNRPTCYRKRPDIITTTTTESSPVVKDVTCTHPGVDKNGEVTTSLYDSRSRIQTRLKSGTQLTYTCRDGFDLIGERVLHCLLTGAWTHPPPTCEPEIPPVVDKACIHPGVDKNGEVTTSLYDSRSSRVQIGFKSGTQLTYICRDGFKLIGERILHCLRTGMWTHPPPTCEPRVPSEVTSSCPYHGDVPNIQVRPRVLGKRVRALTELTLKCDKGYKLQGTDVVFCLPDGSWSNNFPTCIPDFPEAGGVTCPHPGKDINGMIDIRMIDPRNEGQSRFTAGTRIRYSCKEEYVLYGEPTIYCLNTGVWSHEAPTCHYRDPEGRNDEAESDCEHLDAIINGRVVVYRTFESQLPPDALEDSADMEHPVGTILVYSCNIGYILKGSRKLTCEETGDWSDNPPACVEDCGLSIVEANRRITNGNKTEPGEWPWMVSISVPGRNNHSVMICGGALLDRRTVLTAAHCFSDQSYYILHFGKFHRRDEGESAGVEVRRVRSMQVITHSDFNKTTYAYDIALIRLESELLYTERILPICLPTPQSTQANLAPGSIGIVTGWGITEKGLTADELLKAELPVQSDRECMRAYRKQRLNIRIGPGMFCAGFREGVTSACRGDSGSPFVFFNSTSQRYTIEGCVSFSVQGQCGIAERYTTFTKILYFMPWIKDNWKW